MEFIYSYLKGFPTNILDYEIVPYVYKNIESVIKAGDLYVLRKELFPLINNRKLIEIAAEYGRLSCMKWLCKQHGITFTRRAKGKAAEAGHLDCLIWLHKHHDPSREWDQKPYPMYIMDYAAAGGHLHILKWLHGPGGASFTPYTMQDAATKGQLHVIKWLHEQGVPYKDFVMDEAARGGHLDCMIWLYKHYDIKDTTYAMNEAAGFGHLHVLEWLYEHDLGDVTKFAMIHAVRGGHLHVIKWLHEHGISHTPEDIEHAVRYGYDDVADYLRGVVSPSPPCFSLRQYSRPPRSPPEVMRPQYATYD